MAGRLVNQGEQLILEAIVNKTAPETLKLKLFTNNLSYTEAKVEGDLTECSAAGYAAISLTGASWSSTGADPSHVDFAQQTFTLTAASTVYGYYYAQTSSGKLIGLEIFSDGPYVVPSGGGTIKVTPQLSMKDTVD